MTTNVYVLGSINYDIMISSNRIPVQGETIQGFGYHEGIGGKGANQAVSLARLGIKPNFIGSVGRDLQGSVALSKLKEEGVVVNNINISDDITGRAIIINTDNDNRIIINQGANFDISKEYLKSNMTGRDKDLFLTQFETPLDIVYNALSIAKQKNMITIVNPAPAKVIDNDYYELTDYLIINQSEAELLTGIFPRSLGECRETAKILLNRGVKNVVVTLGSDGSVFISKKEFIYTKSHSVHVFDTTGAGDTFIGTFIYGLSKDWDIEKILEYSSAAGALACTKKGAQDGMPTYKLLEEFILNGGKYE